jgi:GT2 family glycosyltransferase
VNRTLGCVLLTMGDRPTELARAVASLRDQEGADLDVLVVVNGAEDVALPDGARGLVAGDNLGIPAGRNLGLREVRGDVVLFLDDDAWVASPRLAETLLDRFAADERLGAISCRLADEEGHTQRRHVPRLRVGDVHRSSLVTTFLGGATAVRREAFVAAGGLPEEFFYGHEETSLAWRLLDRGWRLRYDADLVIRHPRTTPGRHATARHLSARNRVLLARRHLPAPIGVVYVVDWLALSLLRDAAGWRSHLAGTLAGLRQRAVPRDRLRWRTLWTLTRLGRPPIL